MKTLPLPSCQFALAGLLAAMAAMTSAEGVELRVSLEPSGPVAVGATVTVRLSVHSWNPADGEVDGVAFNVDFDPAVFTYVPGSGSALTDGTEFLAMANQGAGYSLLDETFDGNVGFGRFTFGAVDVGDATGGSEGPDGPLGSFQLTAIADSAGSLITPQVNDLNDVFFDEDILPLSLTAGLTLTSVSPLVFEPMTYAIWRAGIPFPSLPLGEPGADPDGDGMLNQFEYGLDFDPLVPDADQLPSRSVTNVDGKNYSSITYDRPTGVTARSDLTYGGERSINLIKWFSAQVTVESVDPGPPGYETVTIRSTVELTNLIREFLRITTEL